MIAVYKDAEGLLQAAVEMMEDAFDAPEREKNERLAEIAANPEALLSSMPSRRTLSPGYYIWLGYVTEFIAQPLEEGIAFHPADLDADEIMTLRILSEARAKFLHMHPACRGCGKPLPDPLSKSCNECQRAEFEADARGRR